MLKNKISKKSFDEYIKAKKETYDLICRIYDSTNGSLDLSNFENDICQPLYILEDAIFDETEFDLIQWFLFEYDENHMKIWDSNTHEVIADIIDSEALWEYLNRE